MRLSGYSFRRYHVSVCLKGLVCGPKTLEKNVISTQRMMMHQTALHSRHLTASIGSSRAFCVPQKISIINSLTRLSTLTDTNNTICWKCRKEMSAASKFFCEHCTAILPQRQLTYFEILEFDDTFDIPIVELQKRFKDLQRLFHPDKFTLKSEEEKQMSEQVSSLINIAYSTLLDPLQRGVYLLTLKGITISEDTQLSDPEFLMEIMELNEQIASSQATESIVNLQTQITNVCKELIGEISKAFQNDQWEEAKTLIVKLRYYNNMMEKLKHMIPPS